MVNTKESQLTPIVGDTVELDAWLDNCIKHRTPAEQHLLIDAYNLAAELHQHQRRASGEPYLTHVVTVADILVDLGMDVDVIVAALLHDSLDKTDLTLAYLRQRFGQTVAQLVDGVHKMRFIDKLAHLGNHEEEGQREALRKMLLAMVEDIRVVLIKLADRLHNMRTLRYLSPEKQVSVARETLDLFAPLANRLGIWQIKWELEDLALRYMEPETYKTIAKQLDERRIDREEYIQHIIETLRTELKQAGIQAEITGRPKHIYSIWLKMKRKGLGFDKIFDVRAVRLLVGNVTECYTALGVIHTKWQPIHGEFDDYIANPKNNNYQSLHTAVLGHENKVFEVQIRTHEMHHHSELGVASHWRYKEGKHFDEGFEQKIAWLRQMLQWKDEEGNTGDFVDRFKSEMLEERVYVLSPKGRVVDLPHGATPLDFAYYIHTDLGHRCRGAKVNNRMVSLTYMLKSGDQIEILTTNIEKPSRDWLLPHLGYLKTSRARNKVKYWLKKQDSHEHVRDGQQILDRELQRLNLTDLSYEKIASLVQVSNVNELLAGLGRGDITIAHITHVINEDIFPKKQPAIPIVSEPDFNTEGVKIKGISGLLTQTARCCKPVPYDSIVGYITKGRGVVIHRRDCPNAVRWQDEDNERLIEVDWGDPNGQDLSVYPVDIHVDAYDRTGLLRDVSTIAANEKINIISAHTTTDKSDNKVVMNLTIEVTNLNQLSRALARIDGLPNVLGVSRKH